MKNEFDYLNNVKMDFSDYEEISLSEMERAKMKNVIKKNKKLNRGKIIALAACVGTVAVFSQTVFAKELFSNIIKSFSTGHNQFFEMDDSNLSAALPKELKGLVFDKDGNEVSEFRADSVYYDKNGAEISNFEEFIKDNLGGNDKITYVTEDGEVIVGIGGKDSSGDPLEDSKNFGYPIINDINEINSYLSFASKLPQYLPDGYEFYGASAYGEDYLFVYYKNADNKYITVHERIINDDTAFSTSTNGSIEEIEINGNKAVMMDNSSIDWENGEISLSVQIEDDNISSDELIKIAESME